MKGLFELGLVEARRRLLGDRNLFSISEVYHENSKIARNATGFALSAESIFVAPTGFKRYMHAPKVGLLAPEAKQASPILRAIAGRRSCRLYSGAPVAAKVIADLAFCSFGISDGRQLRCAPSAGGLYPLELYIIAMNVTELDAGLYHYDVRAHGLTELVKGDLSPQLVTAMPGLEGVEKSAALMVFTAVFGRSKIKYGERAYRFVLLEAGHAMQNICLAATDIGVGVCPVGGFVDDSLNDLLNIDGIEEAAVYAVTMGTPADSSNHAN
ncbi:SagB/ThcOx family dehydrogenase [Bradyrhizobium sp. 190]|uniref:SagB/ThcOx family dehydrogenase n=1 Tax=Bradyrhizobium sp. 190 TaxID=2782658 RepID=UPI001FF9948B|nr:SagB/ThcOx family dehydrogenase [Bradyrhizobium sp. 190]MCK1516514.1 SagB/ThcOx family dehydrogenase [Bradyrhizobium sp. 190]